MRKLLAALVVTTILMSCSQEQKGYEIQGTLNGDLEAGVQAFLRKRNEEGRFINLDTTIVVDGKYSFTGQQEELEIFYIFFDVTRGNIPVIVENATIQVTAQRDSLQYFKLKGTLQNELFQDFLEGSRVMSYRARAMTTDMRKAAADMDTVQMNSLRQE